TGMFMSMSKTDMLGYWKRIFSSGFVPGQASHDDQAPQSAAQ
ncbi:TetR/AcrR family transcriptional regulator, partial [Enterococcus durans]|nr:TetR/AcrR family transcriptional regulator [Enterococcus durans]